MCGEELAQPCRPLRFSRSGRQELRIPAVAADRCRNAQVGALEMRVGCAFRDDDDRSTLDEALQRDRERHRLVAGTERRLKLGDEPSRRADALEALEDVVLGRHSPTALAFRRWVPCGIRALAVAALASLALQGQAPAVPPVIVESCSFAERMLAPIAAEAQIQVRYQVIGSLPARIVDFDVLWGDGSVSPIRDVGTFTPGVPINHSLEIYPINGLMTGERVHEIDVAVEGALLSDGTVWTAPLGGAVPVRCRVSP